MKQKRIFCKRLLTLLLCLAMVFTSVNIPSFTVQAAEVTNKYEAKETETLKNGATYDSDAGTVTFYVKEGDACYSGTAFMWYKEYGSYEEAEKNHINEPGGNFIATEGVIQVNLTENDEQTEKSVTVEVSEGTAAILYYFNAPGGRPDYEHIIVIDEADDNSDEVATEDQKADLKTLTESERATVDAGNEEEYTEESWAAYVDAVKAAEAVLANDSATVKEVKDALKALQDAKAGLMVVMPEPDTSAGTAINFASMKEAGNLELWVGGENGWGGSAASYTIDEAGTSITVNCTNIGYAGDAWQIQLKLLNKILKANETYQISFKIVSDSNKMVHFKVGDPDPDKGYIAFADKDDISLTAGVPQTIIVNTTASDEDYISAIFFALGNYGSDAPSSAATITISDLKVYSASAGDAEGGYPEPAEAADIAKLRELYDAEVAFSEADGNNEKYTEKTWESYINAIEAAAVLLKTAGGNAANVTKQQVNKAYDDLTAARNALKVDQSKITTVIISEQEQQAFVGNPVVLNYVANKAFDFKGYTVKVNGKPLDNGKVTVDEDTITIAGDQFQTAGVYTILFEEEGITFTPVYQTVYAANDKWNLIWQDEFNGDTLDLTRWDYQTGNGSEYGVPGWGNEEEEFYTKDNASVGDGTLTITAKKEGDIYTSARIRTVTEDIENGKAGLGEALQKGTYGKIEAKIKMPGGWGVWPAFWMLPYNSEYGTWATSGELDIMEARGRLTNTVCGTIHYGGVWPNNKYSGKDFYFEDGQNITGYHIYAVEWDPDEIRWLVDGEVYSKISNWYAIADEEGNWPYPAPFDEEFYVLLNLAVGGSFDPEAKKAGRIDVDDEGINMDVDYVRWYQRDQDVYDKWEITGPKTEVDESDNAAALLSMADGNGNFIKDADFEEMDTTVGDLEIKYGKWFPLLNPGEAEGGAASWSKVDEDGTNYLKVSVTNTGNQPYAVQMLQYFPLVKGYSYEISYDAYTDTVNNKADVSLKIGGDEDNGWSDYTESYKDDLTTKPTTYTHRFTMSADTDPTARFEFNLATSTGNVYLSNVCVRILQDGFNESDGEDDPKKPKSDGNHIYNGNFNMGLDSLLYWHWSENDSKDVVKSAGKAADGNGRAAGITVNASPISIWQYGINLLQKDDYELTFKVDTTEAQTVKISLTDKDGKVTYAGTEESLSAGNNEVKYTFTQKDVTDENAKLTLTFEKSAELSSVKMIRTSYNNVDWEGVTIWPMYNGDFSNGTDGWIIWSEDPGWEQHTVNAAGQLDMDASIAKDGGAFSCIGIRSKEMVLAKGLKWRVKFDYTLESAKNYTLELAGKQKEITLAAGTNNTYISEPFDGSGSCTFALFLGPDKTDGAYKFILDNVVVYLDDSVPTPDGHKQPVSLSQDGRGKAGSPVVVKYTEDADWGNAEKTYYINGEEIEASKVTEDKMNRKLTIDGSLFPEEDIYQFAVKAEGYERTVPISLTVLDASDNLLVNGKFSLGDTAWATYFQNGCGSFSVNDDKVAVVTHKWNEGQEWHIQLSQEGLEYEAGDYVICFDAWADVERPIGVQLQNGNDVVPGTASKVSLSTEKESYKVVWKGLGANSGVKLDFPMGAVVDGDLSTPQTNHNIYIDNVVFRPARETDVSGKVNKSILGNLLKDYADAKEDENFSSIYAAAEAVYNNADATQDEVNKAVEDLKAGYLVIAKAELAGILDAYKDVTGDEADEKYQAFKKAYDTAVDVSKNEDATLTEVKKAISDLKKAYEVLAGVDKSVLTTALEKYEDSEQYNEEKYTKESWKAFADALEKAKEIAAKEDATQQEVDDALAALEKAANALEEAGEEPGPEKKEGLWIVAIPDQTYTGAAIKPVIQVYDGETLLKEKTDYTVTYKKNTNVGTAEVTVKGKGNYAKAHTETFNIVPKNIADEDITAPDVYAILSKNGTVKTPKISLKYGKKTLKAATKTKENDYSAEFEPIPTNEEDGKLVAGHYTITVTGHGNYTGTREIGYDVLPDSTVLMSKVTVNLSKTTVTYADDGQTERPEVTSVTYGKGAKMVTLEEDQYEVSYERADELGKAAVVVTAKAGSGYYGSKSQTYTVTGTAFKAKDFDVQGISTEGYTYTGEEITPELKVYDKNRKAAEGSDDLYELKEGRDYDVTYSKNTNVGKATITLTGKGGYTGKFTTTFNITKMDLGKKNEEGSGLVWTCEDSAVYTKNKAVPEYTLTYNGTPLTEKKDYKVTCKKNTAVTSEKTAEITITGIGNFTGTISETYAVTTPDASSIYAVASDVTVPKAVNKLKASLKVYEESTGKALKAGTDYEKTFEYYVLDENGKSRDVTVDDLKADTLIHATITLKGNYAGSGAEPATIETEFRLYETKASKLTVDKIPMQVYTGKEIEPVVTVYADKAKTQKLTKGVDYEVEYSNNKYKGTAKVTITGIGNGYGGVKTVTFKIGTKSMAENANWFSKATESIADFFKNLF